MAFVAGPPGWASWGRTPVTGGMVGRSGSWAMARPRPVSMTHAHASKNGMAIWILTRRLLAGGCSLDIEVHAGGSAAPLQVDGQVVRLAQAGVGLERAVRAGHVVAVDGSQHVAVL